MNTLPHRTKLPDEIPAWAGAGTTHFVSVCCQPRGVDQLCHRTTAEGLFETAVFLPQTQRWDVHLLLVMLDRWPALVSFPEGEQMTKAMSSFKEQTAKVAGIGGPRDFFGHRLRLEESVEEKAYHVRMNPVRKGLVASPGDWIWKWESGERANGGPGGPALPQV